MIGRTKIKFNSAERGATSFVVSPRGESPGDVSSDISKYITGFKKHEDYEFAMDELISMGASADGIDVRRSDRLTKSVRSLLGSDGLVVIVIGEKADPHDSLFFMATPDFLHYVDAGHGRKIAGVVVLERSAEVIQEVMERPELKDLLPAVKMAFEHEISHIKLKTNYFGFLFPVGDSETLAQSRAMALRELEGGREAVVNAIGGLIAIIKYTESCTTTDAADILLLHWRDKIGLEQLGLAKSFYLSMEPGKDMELHPNDSAARECMQAADRYYELLRKVLGTQNV